MFALLVGCAAFVATLCAGLFALRFRDKLHVILGFSAGAVIGVAFFDLLPESLELAGKSYSLFTVTTFIAIGFVIYMILDRIILFHSHAESDNCNNEHHHHTHSSKGVLGAASLSAHSFLDGAAIGLAFQVSGDLGLIVATAVLVHDLSDGINTVGLIIKNSGSKSRALSWLLLDAVAPVVGVIATLFFKLPESTLGIILAIFCGFFLYIGASDLLPESRHGHPVRMTTVMTIFGITLMYIAIRLVG
jgi:ZIP family zinc transporter